MSFKRSFLYELLYVCVCESTLLLDIIVGHLGPDGFGDCRALHMDLVGPENGYNLVAKMLMMMMMMKIIEAKNRINRNTIEQQEARRIQEEQKLIWGQRVLLSASSSSRR